MKKPYKIFQPEVWKYCVLKNSVFYWIKITFMFIARPFSAYMVHILEVVY